MNKKDFRTEIQLAEYITNELVWRRSELLEIKKLFEASTHNPRQHDALLRAAVTILYAHWEGFIKQCAMAYICYVAMKKLTYAELAPNFLGIAIKQKMALVLETKSAREYIKFAEFVESELGERSQLDWENAINTESNLSSKVLRNIIDTLGLDYLQSYETRQILIDQKLVGNRNDAAHGDVISNMDKDGFIEIYNVIVGEGNTKGLMEQFADQIMNACATYSYKK